MNPRSLDQILGELDTVYNPQISNIRQQQSLVPQQAEADIAQATAAKDTAFGDILGGARQRGMGFSGIPLQEQAKYASNVFAPQVLRAKTESRQRAMSLEDAINQIYEKRMSFGQQIKSSEDQMFESRRQFDTNMAFQREQEANRLREAARASAAASSAGPTLGGVSPTSGGQAGGQADPYAKVNKNGANASIHAMLKTNDVNRITREINAISNSAAYGNVMDKYKLDLLQSLTQNSAYGPLLSRIAQANQRKVVGVKF
jgi:hypothetical protein